MQILKKLPKISGLQPIVTTFYPDPRKMDPQSFVGPHQRKIPTYITGFLTRDRKFSIKFTNNLVLFAHMFRRSKPSIQILCWTELVDWQKPPQEYRQCVQTKETEIF